MTTGRAPVIFVPGIGGSSLKLGERVVWGDSRMFFSDFDAFTLPGTSLQPGAVIEKITIVSSLGHSIYGPFLTYMRRILGYKDGVDLFLFAYDWRQSCRESGRRLQEFIWDKVGRLASADRQVTIVAHSMGGLVARYCAQLPGMAQRIRRIVTAGTPHRGTPHALNALQFGSTMFPMGYRKADTIPAIRSFPSTYELLPFERGYIVDQDGVPYDIRDASLWRWLSDAQRALLWQAYAFHEAVNDGPDPVPVHSIYGYGQPTLIKVIVPTTPRRKHLQRWDTAEYSSVRGKHGKSSGDDTVPDDNAIRDSTLTCPVNERHADLLNNAAARRYLRDILEARSVGGVVSHAARSVGDLVVDLGDSVFAPNEVIALRIGLRTPDLRYVPQARFRVEVHQTNERGLNKVKVDGFECAEESDGERGELLSRPLTCHSVGTYVVRVVVIDARGINLASRHVDVNFQIRNPA